MTPLDGCPSRDRLARIAAMIHDVEHAVGTVSEWTGGDVALNLLAPRVRRTRPVRHRAGRVTGSGSAA